MSSNLNRRSFLVSTGLTALASTRAWGANERLQVGLIGCGGRLKGVIGSADQSGVPFDIVSVCDVYGPRRAEMKARSNATTATEHVDYREVTDDKTLDAVFIATPDHWHVRCATAALAAGKDVYLEKPVTHTLEEGEVLRKAVRSSKQVLQCGMQQRSWSHFRDAVDLIQGGALGKVPQVRTYWWQNYGATASWTAKQPIDQSQLDWNKWLGGAPDQPFTLDKFFRWRWYWNFGGGAMTDLFTHWIDVVHWAMKSDEPSTAFMLADKRIFQEWDCPDTIQAAFRYPNFDVVYEGMMASSIDDGGLEFRGTEATLKLNRSGMAIYREGIKGDRNPMLKEDSFEDGTIAHTRNFFDCIKSRKEPNAPVETGIAAARAGHIGNYAFHHGGKASWPPKTTS